MLRNTVNIADNLNEETNLSSVIDWINKDFYSELLTENDYMLLNLVFRDNVTQDDFNKFINNWDIETEGGHKALMLAYFMKMHPELNYPEYIKPRLNGFLNYYKFKNIKLMSHFSKICHALKQNNINDILIIKGGAIKHLRPSFPRVMGDIDILIPEKDYIKAGKIAENLGYDADWNYSHSVDIHPKDSEEGLLDIHKYINMDTGYERNINESLFKRASKQKVFNTEIFVPSNEDLVFILLVNMVKNLTYKTSENGILYSLFDCKFLIESKTDFDWNIVIQNAVNTKTEYKLFLGINFINRIVPNLLPDKIKKNNYFEKQFKNYCTLLYFKRFYLDKMRQHSHELKIQDVIKNPRLFKEYMSFKPKYFIFKRNLIRNNPFLTKKILQMEHKFVCE